VADAEKTTVRRLGPGDEQVVRRLAEDEPRTALLADDRTIFLAAFAGDDPVGFVFGYELPRRHGDASSLFIYELGVDEPFRRRGIARRLMTELARIARARGIAEGYVLTEPDNDPANSLYESLGGTPTRAVMWDYRYADD
jgi:ribosomal protein S18 acetylase RimI-like enzyme